MYTWVYEPYTVYMNMDVHRLYVYVFIYTYGTCNIYTYMQVYVVKASMVGWGISDVEGAVCMFEVPVFVRFYSMYIRQHTTGV